MCDVVDEFMADTVSQKFIYTSGKNSEADNVTTLYETNRDRHPQYKITLIYANKLDSELDKMIMFAPQLAKDEALIPKVTINSHSISGFKSLATRGIVGIVLLTQAKRVEQMNDIVGLPYAHGPYLHFVKEYSAVYFDASLSFAIPQGSVKFFHVQMKDWLKIVNHSQNIQLKLFLKELEMSYPHEFSIFMAKNPVALVVHQPWAYLKCIGSKLVENRSRPLFGNSPMLENRRCRACLTYPIQDCKHDIILTV